MKFRFNDFENLNKINSASNSIHSMDIKDIVNSSNGLIDYTKVMSKLNQAINEYVDEYKDKSKGIQYNDKKLITIQNPEGLNTGDTLINGEWGITYGGRDLTLDVDNYRWDIINNKTGVKGYYIIERELIEGDWLNVKRNRIGLGNTEIREMIDKKRLRNKEMIKRDMVIAILNTK